MTNGVESVERRSAPIALRYFAAAAEAAGRTEESVERASVVGTGAGPLTTGDLRAWLVERHGEPMARVLAAGSFLVDGVVSRDDARVVGDRVDVLPPFAGG